MIEYDEFLVFFKGFYKKKGEVIFYLKKYKLNLKSNVFYYYKVKKFLNYINDKFESY